MITHVLSRERRVSCRVVLGELQVGVELERPCEISAVFQPDKGGGDEKRHNRLASGISGKRASGFSDSLGVKEWSEVWVEISGESRVLLSRKI